MAKAYIANTYFKKIFAGAFFLLVGLLTMGRVLGQTPSATLERNQILLGDQIKLTLKLENIPEQTYSLQQWFSIDTMGSHLEVINAGKIDTVAVNGQLSYVQDITITSFDSGKWSVPIQFPVIKDKSTGTEKRLQLDSVYLNVLPVDVKDLKDYHDIKGVVEVKYFDSSKWYWIAGIIVGLILLFVIVRALIKRWKKKAAASGAIPKGYTPLQWALEELSQLEKSNETTKKFYIKLDLIIRNYLDNKLALGSLKKTSDEVMVVAKRFLPEEAIQTTFFQQLRLVDAVKFAKYLPPEEVRPSAITTTKNTLEYIDKQATIAVKNSESNAH